MSGTIDAFSARKPVTQLHAPRVCCAFIKTIPPMRKRSRAALQKLPS